MMQTTAGTPLDELVRIVVEDRCAPAIIERALREVEPYLERTAAFIADEFPAAAPDMMQEARIKLWELDLGRATQRDAAYLERILCNRMIDVYRAECRGGLTSGWSKHSRAPRAPRTTGAMGRRPRCSRLSRTSRKNEPMPISNT